MKGFLVFFISLLCCCIGNITEDLKRVIDYYDRDGKLNRSCVFNYTKINSKTIQFFPKCQEVYGILVINEKTDLSESQLKEELKTIKWLCGGLRIENTHFIDFSFLPEGNTRGQFLIACKSYGVFITNNANLNDPNSLKNLYLSTDDDFNECDFRIENNTNLEVPCYLLDYLDFHVSGNKADCGCRGDEITISSLNHYKKCDTLLGGLKLSNITNTTNLSDLSNIKFIRGNIDIHHTNFQNVSFLQIKTLTISNNETREKVTINFHDNPDMARLAWSISDVRNVHDFGIKTINIENLHPNFCVTVEEMMHFMSLNLFFLNLKAKYCDENPEMIGELKLCNFVSFSKLDNNCGMILGDLLVEAGDEDEFSKLKGVKYLFGTLTIRNTKLEDLDSLSDLRNIASLSGSRPIIQLISNENLKNALLGVVEVIANGNRTAIIQDNHPSLFTFKSCDLFEGECTYEPGNPHCEAKRGTDFTYYGNNCGIEIDKQLSRGVKYKALLIVVLLVLKKL